MTEKQLQDYVGRIVCPIGSRTSLGLVISLAEPIETRPSHRLFQKVNVLWLSRKPKRSIEKLNDLQKFMPLLKEMQKKVDAHNERLTRMFTTCWEHGYETKESR
jgi:tRNA nucleotidyltransferase/poly(A) polymerase